MPEAGVLQHTKGYARIPDPVDVHATTADIRPSRSCPVPNRHRHCTSPRAGKVGASGICRTCCILTHVRCSVLLHPLPLSLSLPVPPSRCTGYQSPTGSVVRCAVAIGSSRAAKLANAVKMRVFFLSATYKGVFFLVSCVSWSHVPSRFTCQE